MVISWRELYLERAYSLQPVLFLKMTFFICDKRFNISENSWETTTAWKLSVFGVFLVHIQSECRKIQTRKTLNTDTFHAVYTEFLFPGNHFFNKGLSQLKLAKNLAYLMCSIKPFLKVNFFKNVFAGISRNNSACVYLFNVTMETPEQCVKSVQI